MLPFASEIWTTLENMLVKPQGFLCVLVETELDLYMQLERDMCAST